MEWIADPTIWIGLATLVVLEIVLGIDNLIFIAILADKLPPADRDRARVIGLVLALVMRLVLLASLSWLVTLTAPLFVVLGQPFSGLPAFELTALQGYQQPVIIRQERQGPGVIESVLQHLDLHRLWRSKK